MSTGNGTSPPAEVNEELDRRRLPEGDSFSQAAGADGGASLTELDLPPARWSSRASLAFALISTLLVCAWWGLLAIPRAEEFQGAAEQTGGGSAEVTTDGDTAAKRTGGGGTEIIYVLASISVLVTLGAVGVRAMSLSVVQQAIEEEDEAATEARADHAEAVRRVGLARKALTDTTCAIDSIPVQVRSECEVQEQVFWEGWHARASARPDLLGTWETLEQRRDVASHTIAELWGASTVPDSDGITEYIAEHRAAAAGTGTGT
jgi:hypothetical protein